MDYEGNEFSTCRDVRRGPCRSLPRRRRRWRNGWRGGGPRSGRRAGRDGRLVRLRSAQTATLRCRLTDWRDGAHRSGGPRSRRLDREGGGRPGELSVDAQRPAAGLQPGDQPASGRVLRRPHGRGGVAVAEVGRPGPFRPSVARRANDPLPPHRRRAMALGGGELLVLSALALRGAQTVAEIRSRIERLLPAGESPTIEELLDALAGAQSRAVGRAARVGDPASATTGGRRRSVRRSPSSRRRRRRRRSPPTTRSADDDITGPLGFVEPAWRDDSMRKRVDELESTVAALAARLERLEQLARRRARLPARRLRR